MHVELSFPVSGDFLPTDHYYLLYSALTHAIRAFHDAASRLRFAPINGEHGGKGLIRLFDRSCLRIRLPDEQIGSVLRLAGRTLDLGAHQIRLTIPTVAALVPAPTLRAKIVTYKNATDAVHFLAVTRQKLDELGIEGEPGIPLIQRGDRVGQPRRQILRIKGRQVVGFSLLVAGLTAEESICLQENGIGGRRRLGCAFFFPWKGVP